MTRFKAVFALIAALSAMVLATGIAYGQAADDGQYDDPAAGGGGSGPLAGASVDSDTNGDGEAGVGDIFTIPGDFGFTQVSSLCFVDADSTIGCFRHRISAIFSLGSLIVEPTDAPEISEAGTDGVLAETGLTVHSSEGITLGATPADRAGALPSTGGEFAMLGAALLVLFGAGYALRRATRGGSDNAAA